MYLLVTWITQLIPNSEVWLRVNHIWYPSWSPSLPLTLALIPTHLARLWTCISLTERSPPGPPCSRINFNITLRLHLCLLEKLLYWTPKLCIFLLQKPYDRDNEGFEEEVDAKVEAPPDLQDKSPVILKIIFHLTKGRSLLLCQDLSTKCFREFEFRWTLWIFTYLFGTLCKPR